LCERTGKSLEGETECVKEAGQGKKLIAWHFLFCASYDGRMLLLGIVLCPFFVFQQASVCTPPAYCCYAFSVLVYWRWKIFLLNMNAVRKTKNVFFSPQVKREHLILCTDTLVLACGISM